MLSSHLAPFLHLPLLVGGNFNSVMHLLEDKSPGKSTPEISPSSLTTPLTHFADGLQLVDLWRLAHPVGKEYSIFSPPHHFLSRINSLFCNSTLLKYTSDSHINVIAISDHAFILVSLIDFLPPNPVNTWGFPSYLSNNQELLKSIRGAWSEYMDTNSAHITELPFSGRQGRPCCGVKLLPFPPAAEKMLTKDIMLISYLPSVVPKHGSPSKILQSIERYGVKPNLNLIHSQTHRSGSTSLS